RDSCPVQVGHDVPAGTIGFAQVAGGIEVDGCARVYSGQADSSAAALGCAGLICTDEYLAGGLAVKQKSGVQASTQLATGRYVFEVERREYVHVAWLSTRGVQHGPASAWCCVYGSAELVGDEDGGGCLH